MNLTPRQREVADLVAQGYTTPQIAEKLGITINTAKNHTKVIFQVLGVNNRVQLANKWRGK